MCIAGVGCSRCTNLAMQQLLALQQHVRTLEAQLQALRPSTARPAVSAATPQPPIQPAAPATATIATESQPQQQQHEQAAAAPPPAKEARPTVSAATEPATVPRRPSSVRARGSQWDSSDARVSAGGRGAATDSESDHYRTQRPQQQQQQPEQLRRDNTPSTRRHSRRDVQAAAPPIVIAASTGTQRPSRPHSVAAHHQAPTPHRRASQRRASIMMCRGRVGRGFEQCGRGRQCGDVSA